MKKTYINPTMEVVKMNIQQQMLAGSLNMGSGTGTVTESSAPGGVAAEGHDDDFDW